MRSKRLGDEGRYLLVFDKGDEVMASLLEFARQAELSAASFKAIGAFSGVTLGFFERKRKDYKRIPLEEQVEVLTLTSDIAVKNGEPHMHAHVVVGKRTATPGADTCSRPTFGRRSNSSSSNRRQSSAGRSTRRLGFRSSPSDDRAAHIRLHRR